MRLTKAMLEVMRLALRRHQCMAEMGQRELKLAERAEDWVYEELERREARKANRRTP